MYKEITPSKVFVGLIIIILFLVLGHMVGLLFSYGFGHRNVFGLVPLFDLNRERNVPTLYSSLTIIICAFLLLMISLEHKKMGSSYFPWFFLSLIFLFLSIDETAMLHEKIIDPTREFFNNPSGIFYWAWVIPYGIGVMILVLFYARFLIRLPKKVRYLFVLSGIIFVSGAIGLELFGSRHYEIYGINNLTFGLLAACEEFLEMLGIATFIYSLLVYIDIQFNRFTITIKQSN
jgi:hypothetical protein